MTSILLAKKIRRLSLDMVHRTNASHIGGAFSVADILAVLYSDILKYDPRDPKWSKRDRLLYSKGHSCTSLYAVLMECGFYTSEVLDTFSQNGSSFTTHVNHNVPGVELSTGSLGHALSVGCGISFAGKLKRSDFHTYVILSDGELDEGSNWEAILFAGHHKLNNLTVIVDYNKIQSLGSVNEVMNLEPLGDKFSSFGWDCQEIDGHHHPSIFEALKKDRKDDSKPFVMLAHTVKGKGVDFMENQLLWHYRTPNAEQYALAVKQLDQT